MNGINAAQFDVILEAVRALVVAWIFLFALIAGRQRNFSYFSGWRWIVGGFGLLAFASILDVTDNFDSLNHFVIIGDTPTEAFLEKLVGYLGGFVCLFIGIRQWLPIVAELNETRAAVKLREQETILSSALHASPDLIAISCLADGRHHMVNKTWLEVMGYREKEVLGKTATELDLWASEEERRRMVDTIHASGELCEFETQLKTKSGRVRDILMSGVIVTIEDEERLLIIGHDITNRKGIEKALEHSERELRAILDNMAELFYRADTDGRIVFAAGAAKEITGWTAEELIGLMIAERYIDPHGRKVFLKQLHDNDGKVRNYETVLVTKSGQRVWGSTNAEYWRDQNGAILGIEGTVRDVTQAVEAREMLEHMAHHDVLTGLGNRRSFERHLSEALARARRNKKTGALIYFDLDGFKPINDTLGHDAGDDLLRETAKRLRAVSRETDIISRMGGDEFCIIAEDISGHDGAARVADKVIEAITTDYKVESKAVRIGVSIGISQFDGSEDAEEIAVLVSSADRAMYEAKHAGGNTYRFDDEVSSLVQLHSK